MSLARERSIPCLASKPASERTGFIILLVVLSAACGSMILEGSWQGGAPGMSSLPELGKSVAALSLVLLYTIQATIAVILLFQRRISLMCLAVGCLLTAPTVLAYLWLASTAGLAAPAVQVDEFARVILAAGSAIILIAPWVYRPLRWPYRTPGHLAFAISILASGILQIVFHLVLVIPGSELSFAEYDRARGLISRTASPLELQRLVEIEALPLQEIDRDNAEALLETARAVSIPTIQKSIERTLSDAPSTLHTWQIPGDSKIDRMALVYDGREEAATRLWLLPADAFLLPRLNAISAYYVLVGLSGLVWMIGALLVHVSHERRRRA
jgi:hypothetical protein